MSSCKFTVFPPLHGIYAIGAPRSFQGHAEEQGKSVDWPAQKENADYEIEAPQRAAGDRLVAFDINHSP